MNSSHVPDSELNHHRLTLLLQKPTAFGNLQTLSKIAILINSLAKNKHLYTYVLRDSKRRCCKNESPDIPNRCIANFSLKIKSPSILFAGNQNKNASLPLGSFNGSPASQSTANKKALFIRIEIMF
jgi:hypothetical protein